MNREDAIEAGAEALWRDILATGRAKGVQVVVPPELQDEKGRPNYLRNSARLVLEASSHSAREEHPLSARVIGQSDGNTRPDTMTESLEDREAVVGYGNEPSCLTCGHLKSSHTKSPARYCARCACVEFVSSVSSDDASEVEALQAMVNVLEAQHQDAEREILRLRRKLREATADKSSDAADLLTPNRVLNSRIVLPSPTVPELDGVWVVIPIEQYEKLRVALGGSPLDEVVRPADKAVTPDG